MDDANNDPALDANSDSEDASGRRGGDRRKSQETFDGEDRRKGDRRSGTDRRKSERRSGFGRRGDTQE
ncbi:hypothetical protein [Erythrobacter sp. YT30]|uniref:hypothetical protein n=1 Tax=Erythrobacter sp. YT30 TaxID=1735012 RepID=UPI0012E3CFFD|nr:hypothetical protein [Erythrobacter sp. YT30]